MPPRRSRSTSASTGSRRVARLAPLDRAELVRKVPGRPRTVLETRTVREPPPAGWTSCSVQCAECLAYRGFQILIGQGRRRCGGAEEIGARAELGPDLPGDRSQPAPNPVAYHCATGTTADGVGDPRRFGGAACQPGYRDRPPSHTSAALAQGLEGGLVTDRPDQAVRLWRPLRRRLDRMARPALVDIRWRKPCFFARLRTFG